MNVKRESAGIPYYINRLSLAVRIPRTSFTHKKNVVSFTYDSSETRTGTGGITSNIHVSAYYELTHYPEAHQEVLGNMGISNFKKGKKQKAHGEQLKFINRER